MKNVLKFMCTFYFQPSVMCYEKVLYFNKLISHDLGIRLMVKLVSLITFVNSLIMDVF